METYPCKECILLNNCSSPCPTIRDIVYYDKNVTNIIINKKRCPACSHKYCKLSTSKSFAICVKCKAAYMFESINEIIKFHSFSRKQYLENGNFNIHCLQINHNDITTWNDIIDISIIPRLKSKLEGVNKIIDESNTKKASLIRMIDDCMNKDS